VYTDEQDPSLHACICCASHPSKLRLRPAGVNAHCASVHAFNEKN
jgi:hypothetical protein